MVLPPYVLSRINSMVASSACSLVSDNYGRDYIAKYISTIKILPGAVPLTILRHRSLCEALHDCGMVHRDIAY